MDYILGASMLYAGFPQPSLLLSFVFDTPRNDSFSPALYHVAFGRKDVAD